VQEIDYQSGDILNWVGKVDVIGHQVNCLGIMGGGLALQIARKYPKVEKDYINYIRQNSSKSCLGRCFMVPIENGCHIANLFGQYDVGVGIKTDYKALSKSFEELKKQMIQHNMNTLALPVNLGCGLAGGNWATVLSLIKKAFGESDIQVILINYK